jgi:coenzyme F420-reducing hydrogenase delta subunit/DNA-binding transcriptional ArsR family regulator
MAGVSRLQYSTNMRLIRVMCSGRVDLEHILRAFSKGADAVFIGGCRLNECNYITHGNYDALGNVLMFKKIMEHIELNPERLRIEFMTSGDGLILTNVINEFCKQAEEFGPLGKTEGIDGKILKFKLDALAKLIPYIKLVERERLRVPHKSEETYMDFFAGDKFKRLFKELILDKLAVSQIVMRLRQQPLSTGEMSEKLGMNPSEISRHMNTSTRHGMVRFDKSEKRYALR